MTNEEQQERLLAMAETARKNYPAALDLAAQEGSHTYQGDHATNLIMQATWLEVAAAIYALATAIEDIGIEE